MRLSDSLSNLPKGLTRLLAALNHGDLPTSPQVTAIEPDSMVATDVRECRMLTPDEVAGIAEEYRRGATVRELARKHGVHRHTLDRHLERLAVAKRPVMKMTPARLARAKELYEQGWSTQRVGQELGVSQGAVYKALVRAGVMMRSPAALRRER